MTLEQSIQSTVEEAVRRALEQQLPHLLAGLTLPPDPDKGYTVPEAAQYLRVTTSCIKERLKAGELDAIKLGRYLVIPHSSIQALVARELAKARANHLPTAHLDLDGVDDDITRELGLTAPRRTTKKKAPQERRLNP